MECLLCNMIRSLIWGKIVHFTCITKDWYVFCPCWCAAVFSAQLLVFCDSFLMKLGLGAAVPSISFIFLWQRVLAWILILKSWGRSAEALRHWLPSWGQAIPPFVELHYYKGTLLCLEKQCGIFNIWSPIVCVCFVKLRNVTPQSCLHTLQALNAIPPKASSLEEVCCQRSTELPPTHNAALGSCCFISLLPVTHFHKLMANWWPVHEKCLGL